MPTEPAPTVPEPDPAGLSLSDLLRTQREQDVGDRLPACQLHFRPLTSRGGRP